MLNSSTAIYRWLTWRERVQVIDAELSLRRRNAQRHVRLRGVCVCVRVCVCVHNKGLACVRRHAQRHVRLRGVYVCVCACVRACVCACVHNKGLACVRAHTQARRETESHTCERRRQDACPKTKQTVRSPDPTAPPYVCVYVYEYVCVCIRKYVYMHVCVLCVCMYLCIYVYMHVCIW
jgi:hypothetical protein